MIACIHCSVLGISGHRCGPSLSPSSGLDVKRCPGSSSFSLVRTWSPVLIHAQGRLWCKVKEKGGVRERKKGREWVSYCRLVSDLSSQCPPHISACWQPFGAITCHALTDLCAMCFMHTELFVWSGGKCAVSKLTPGKEAERKARRCTGVDGR